MLSGPDIVSNIAIRYEPWAKRGIPTTRNHHCFAKSTVYTPSQFDPTSRTCFQLPALSCPPTNASQGNNHIADITKSQLELLGHCVVSSCPLPTVLSTHAQQDQLSEVKMSSIIASQLGIVVLRSASLLPILQKVKYPFKPVIKLDLWCFFVMYVPSYYYKGVADRTTTIAAASAFKRE